MAFNPQISPRGDLHLFQGMSSIADGIGKLSEDLKKQKEEIKKREQEDKEISAKIKIFTKDNPVDLTGATLDEKRGIFAGLLDRENSQVNQAKIRESEAVTHRVLQELKNQKEINDRWQKAVPELLKDPSLTDRQRAIIGSGLQLPSAAVTRLMEEHSNLTPAEAIDLKNANLREDEVGMKKRALANGGNVEVKDIRPGLILVNDKDGPRVIKDPSFNQPVDPTSIREAQYLDGLIKEGKYEEAARYSNQVLGLKDASLGLKWTPDDFKPKDAPESSETPKGKDYNIGGTNFKVLTR